MSTSRRFRLDRTVERFRDVLLGGSPLRVLRFNTVAQRVLDDIWSAAATGETFDLADGAHGDAVTSDRDRVPHQIRDQVVAQLVSAGVLHPCPPVKPLDDRVTLVTPAFGSYQPRSHSRVPRVVVDDGSNPPIPDATIRFEHNRGPAAARNAGLASVTTPFVAFVDTDVSLTDDWLEGLIGHFDDPSVALVAPRVMAASANNAGQNDEAERSRLERYEAARSPLDLGSDPALVAIGGRVGYVPSTAIVCRTDALRQVGGFDEALRFGEDVDLVWRLNEAGFRCRYDPAVVVTHPPRSTWRDWWRQRVGYGTSAAPLAVRHGDAVAPARLSRWSFASWIVVLGGPLSWLASAAITAGSAAVLPRRISSLPPGRARRLAIEGTWRAGGQLAQAVRRGWWPLLLVASLGSRRARRALMLSLLAARSPVRIADDVAYSVGVWKGCMATRSLRALAPKIT